MQVLVQSEPPSKDKSRYEKIALGRMRQNRGKWFLVQIASQPFIVPSFLADSSNIETEAGIRRLKDLPNDIVQTVYSQTKAVKMASEDAEFYCLWARYISHSRTKKSINTPGITSTKRYSPDVHNLTKRLYEQAKEYNPNDLTQDKSEDPEWLEAMSRLITTTKGGATTIESLLDFVFGLPNRGSLPDQFWKDKIGNPSALERNKTKIADAKFKQSRRSKDSAKPQVKPRKQETRTFQGRNT